MLDEPGWSKSRRLEVERRHEAGTEARLLVPQCLFSMLIHPNLMLTDVDSPSLTRPDFASVTVVRGPQGLYAIRLANVAELTAIIIIPRARERERERERFKLFYQGMFRRRLSLTVARIIVAW
jgi:hypothetical protein